MGIRISVYLHEGLVERIDKLATTETRSRSQQIAHMLGRSLEERVRVLDRGRPAGEVVPAMPSGTPDRRDS